MRVDVLNPEVVTHLIEEVGRFAYICKAEDNDEQPEVLSKETAERIGLNCLKQGHTSTSRADYIKFRISGISRVCSHQLVRHSIGTAINQQSGVFGETNISKETFIQPGSYKALDEDTMKELDDLLDKSRNLYIKLRTRGISRSDARYVSLQGQRTSMHMAMDFEALVNLFERRLCSKAQPEIRAVAAAMKQKIIELEPRLEQFFDTYCVHHGGCKEATPCGYYKHKQ